MEDHIESLDTAHLFVEDTSPTTTGHSTHSGSNTATSAAVPQQRTKIVFYDSDDEDDRQKLAAAAAGNSTVKSAILPVVSEYELTTDQEDLVDDILFVEQKDVDAFFEDAKPTPPSGGLPLMVSSLMMPGGLGSVVGGAAGGATTSATTKTSGGIRYEVVPVPEEHLIRPAQRGRQNNDYRNNVSRVPRYVADPAAARSTKKRYRDSSEEREQEDLNASGIESNDKRYDRAEGEVIEEEGPAVVPLEEPLETTHAIVLPPNADPCLRNEQQQEGKVAEDEELLDEKGDEGACHVVRPPRLVKISDGYRLTLDEADLQDTFDDDGDGDEGGQDAPAPGEMAEGHPPPQQQQEEDEDDEDFDGDLDDEESSDDELDDSIVDAAVSAMINCCKDPEVCEQITCKKFVEIAEEQLAKKAKGEVTQEAFDEIMMSEVVRLQRQLRKWNRPPPAEPVIINGVKMDF